MLLPGRKPIGRTPAPSPICSGRPRPSAAGPPPTLPAAASAEAIQNVVFEVGKCHPFADLRSFFGCLYQVLLGQQEGPRFGGFAALYGIPETIALIRTALARRADAA